MMLVTATAFLQPHHSLVEETLWSRGVPLCLCCASSEGITSGIDVEVPKDSENALRPAQLLDLE